MLSTTGHAGRPRRRGGRFGYRHKMAQFRAFRCPDSDHLRGTSGRVRQAWGNEFSQLGELGSVPMPEDRGRAPLAHATYWPDCDCGDDDSIMWRLSEFNTNAMRADRRQPQL